MAKSIFEITEAKKGKKKKKKKKLVLFGSKEKNKEFYGTIFGMLRPRPLLLSSESYF